LEEKEMASNPNVAQGGGGLGFLDSVPTKATVQVSKGLGTSGVSVGTPYSCSNSDSVGSLPAVYSNSLPGQDSMAPKGNKPGFKKLQPKNMPTSPGSMGTNYKP
jgi:hypothetical protein